MTERSLVLMGGAPGSGTTRLGLSLERQLQQDGISINHISTGDHVRRIGTGAIHSAMTADIIDHLVTHPQFDPIDDDVIRDLVHESLGRYETSDVVLLDGYPRYPAQVEAAEELAYIHDRTIKGMLLTDVDPEAALIRMIKRGQKYRDRAITLEAAIDRLATYNANLPHLLEEVRAKNIPIEIVPTHGAKEVTTGIGSLALRTFLS
jgi:adenylate kinase family enzyme